MLEYKKEDMVDFVVFLFKANHKRISKARIESLEESEIIKVIESTEQTMNAFNEFLELKKNGQLPVQKKAKPASSTAPKKNIITGEEVVIPSDPKEAETKLLDIINKLCSNSTNFMYIMELKGYLSYLPYGTVPDDVLKAQADILLDAAGPIATLLIDYYLKQLEKH